MLFFMPKKRHNTASTILVEFSPEGNNLKISFWEHKKNLFCFFDFKTISILITQKKSSRHVSNLFFVLGQLPQNLKKKLFFWRKSSINLLSLKSFLDPILFSLKKPCFSQNFSQIWIFFYAWISTKNSLRQEIVLGKIYQLIFIRSIYRLIE